MIRFKPSLSLGKPAPDFSQADSGGRVRTRAEFLGRWLVLFFYPADFTSGCTEESCSFRDRYQDFQDAGAQVIGISGDSGESHQAFAAQHRLPYPLLSDRQAVMRKAYTVPHLFGRLSGRSTFVIDPTGILRYIFDSRSAVQSHISNSLEIIQNAHR